MAVVIRQVDTMSELIEAFDVMGAQFPAPFTHEHRRFADLARHFPAYRSLMLVVDDGTRIVGGALAFRMGEE